MKKWTKEEEELIINLLKSGVGYKEISNKLNRSYRSIKNKLNSLGYKQKDYNKTIFYEKNNCEVCSKEFESLKSENRRFCSKSCSATHNNKGVVRNYEDGFYSLLKPNNNLEGCEIEKRIFNCSFCNKEITKNIRRNRKFCSNGCSNNYKKEKKDKQIENGEISYHKTLKRYLLERREYKCEICEISVWMNNSVPLILDHINGDTYDNLPANLRLICPNCDAQTDTYKGKNKGKGRYERMKRYYENKSY